MGCWSVFSALKFAQDLGLSRPPSTTQVLCPDLLILRESPLGRSRWSLVSVTGARFRKVVTMPQCAIRVLKRQLFMLSEVQ